MRRIHVYADFDWLPKPELGGFLWRINKNFERIVDLSWRRDRLNALEPRAGVLLTDANPDTTNFDISTKFGMQTSIF